MQHHPARREQHRSLLCMPVWMAAIASLHAILPTAHADAVVGVLPEHVVSENGSFRLTLESTPAPIPLNELFQIVVAVDASAASDVSDNPVWLRGTAEMPAHQHGMNTRVIVEQLETGRFLLKGLLFHMRGEWLITFDVAKGRTHEQVRVKVLL